MLLYLFRPLKHRLHGRWLICAWSALGLCLVCASSAAGLRLVCAWSALTAPWGCFSSNKRPYLPCLESKHTRTHCLRSLLGRVFLSILRAFLYYSFSRTQTIALVCSLRQKTSYPHTHSWSSFPNTCWTMTCRMLRHQCMDAYLRSGPQIIHEFGPGAPNFIQLRTC